jgi:predicted permease
MDLFFLLITNLIPLYILIVMGWVAGRYLDVNLHSMAIVAINLIAPVVVFGAVAQLEFESKYLLLPLVMAAVSTLMSLGNYSLAKMVFREDNTPSLLGMGAVNGNTGYFGLPIVLLLFGPEGAGIYLLANIGSEFITLTLGYYLGAKGNHSPLEALKIVLRLPIIYAMVLGIFWNLAGLELYDVFITYWERFTGAWVIIGMILIGVALGRLSWSCLRWKTQLWLMTSRLIVWPAVMISIIYLDRFVLHVFDGRVHTLLLIFGLVPLSGNLVAFAAKLNVRPSEATFAVLITTLLALLTMPLAFLILNAPFN